MKQNKKYCYDSAMSALSSGDVNLRFLRTISNLLVISVNNVISNLVAEQDQHFCVASDVKNHHQLQQKLDI